MKSLRETQSVIFCLAVTLAMSATSSFAASRVTQRTSPARSASWSATAQPRSTATIPNATMRRATAARETPARATRQTITKRTPAMGNPPMSRNQPQNAPRPPERSRHGDTRNRYSDRYSGNSNHRPALPQYRDSRHHSTHFGFNFNIGHVAPPPLTVFEPVYVQPVPVGVPAIVAPPPVMPVPTVQPALPITQGVLFDAFVSRDDHIAPKKILTVDGIMLKIKDTDAYPLDVDIELGILDHEYNFEDLPIGSRVDIYGQSGQLYHVDIIAIDDDTETLRFTISQ